jgi:hypothetical protein
MPATKPGEAVPASKRGPERAWFIFKYLNPASAEDPKTSFVAGFNRAYRDSIADQVEFSDLQRLLGRLLDVLEELRVERDVVRSLAIDEEESA